MQMIQRVAEKPTEFDVAEISHILCCSVCASDLEWTSSPSLIKCRECGRNYPLTEGIPGLFAPNDWPDDKPDVTDIVKEFYEETPFPNYDDLDNRDSLRKKASRGVFARLLDEQLPRPAVIFEVGCGTGQLSNFLGMRPYRTVVGGDICLNSLRLAKSFRDRFSINNAHFVQMNLFRVPFRDESFDVVIANGVLHHTSDAKAGFLSIVRKLKPRGYVIVGLYNSLGRVPTLWRRRLIEVFGDGFTALDSRLRKSTMNEARWQAWFRDQYKHPHETRHSMDDVLDWFNEAGIDFRSSIPTIGPTEFTDGSQLFQPHPAGTRMDRVISQLGLLLSGGRDGGFFIMIGRKRP